MTDYRVFQVPGYISKITTMSGGSVRLMVDTQETVKPTDAAQLMSYINQPGWFTFNVHQIEATDIVNLPPVQKTEKKSKSQQLRAVLYRLWEQSGQGDFEKYYDDMMDKLISHYKEKLT